MRDLPPGWATDVAVLRHSGSVVEDRGDHLVVHTPQNPDYHWGNCILVLDERSVGDADRWIEVFEAAHPDAAWVSVGLITEPDDAAAWTARQVVIEGEDVLTSRQRPRTTPLAEGYSVRRIAGDDWEQVVAAEVADNELTGAYEPGQHERFARAQTDLRRRLSDTDLAAFFGAFADGVLASSLGIVVCDATARYQSVGTDAGHRRRGLAGHLLGVAAEWSAGKGCDTWVIITEAGNPAGRLYRSVGFTPDVCNARAYRAPAR
jgi:GNAT superfamily N-acetyltransferase